MKTDELLELAPYDGSENSEHLFMEALKEELQFHYQNNQMYRRFCERKKFDPFGDFALEDIPPVSVSVFKELGFKLNSVPEENLTLTLQLPKLSFLFPENQMYIGRLKVLDIRLSKQGIDKIDANYTLIEENDIRPRLLHRDPFAHKGKMGNALIIAGSYGMGGASVLATKACLRAGAGKVTTHTPKRNSMLLQISVPEAIIQFDREETIFSEAVDTEDFNAVGIGPGLGTSEQTAIAIIAQLRRTQCPIVADADAINVVANHRAWLQQLPKGIIMTPHPKEFDRLEGPSTDSYERLMKARDLAQRLHGYILVKGHHTSLCLPDGHIMFNSTGNAGMATAGSGDVLTGIITGLLARGYKHEDACVVGMYLHGLAGDIAARELGVESVIASDLIQYIPQAFKRINE